MKNPNNNKKWTQAEKTVHRWTGVRPDQTKAEDIPTDRKNGLQARRILTKGIYAANPELAFGIVRRMLTGNQMRASDFSWFINNHPAFKQLAAQALTGNGATFEVDGELLEEAKASEWGKKNQPSKALEVFGEVEIQWVDKDGVKSEKVPLGFEMIQYATDSRPYVALNCGGGSAIRRFLIRSGPRPDYKINNDAESRRYVKRGTTVEKVEQEEEAALEEHSESMVARLLAGETISW